MRSSDVGPRVLVVRMRTSGPTRSTGVFIAEGGQPRLLHRGFRPYCALGERGSFRYRAASSKPVVVLGRVRESVVKAEMRNWLVACFGLLVLGLPAPARADAPFVGFVGFAYGRSSTKFENAQRKWEFTGTNLSLEGYGIAEVAYFKISHGFAGAVGTQSAATVTDKSGQPLEQGTGRYSSDSFLFVLPRMEFGAAFSSGALKPTLGISLGDGDARIPPDAKTLFYSVDTGIVAGLALVLGSETTAFVVHPTLRFNASFYNAQRHFADGSGGAAEVVMSVKFLRNFSVFTRFGADGHTLHGKNWPGIEGESTMKQGSSYFRFGFGYAPF